jgi:AcrR family transcriptional regulator
MRSLAARARVSLATPYNLFGSKQGVLDALLQTNLDMFRQALSGSVSRDPIVRIFDVVSLAAQFYLADPAFYKALYLALFEAENVELRNLYSAGRQQFWEGLLAEATASHHLEPDTDTRALSRTLRYVVTGALHSWATSGITSEQLEAELGYGVSMALMGMATMHSRGQIECKLRSYQRRIAELAEREAKSTLCRTRASAG